MGTVGEELAQSLRRLRNRIWTGDPDRLKTLLACFASQRQFERCGRA
jgi:hypothetical protein